MSNIQKEWYFLFFVGLIGLFIFYKTILSTNSGNVHITLMQQKGAIKHLDTVRKKRNEENFFIENINFPSDRVLSHKQFGKIDYKTNFFVDATTTLEVLKAGKYTFYIKSDDGFRLKLDKNTVCQFPNNRAMKMTACSATLEEKSYDFHLSYFQGGGPLGLQVYYKYDNTPTRHLIGNNSEYIIFKAPKK